MIGGVFTASSALAAPPAVLVTLITSVILLAIRAWVGTVGLTLTRREAWYLDGAIVVFVVIFFAFVVIRFANLA